jgi:O-methyltransferase involved in polyketide biosynthesis
MPSPEGDYTLLSTSVADHHQWLPNVPADRPTIAIMEGLTMYLREEEGKRLLQSIVSRFAGVGGQLAFDCYGSLAIRLQGLMKPVQNTGSELHWGIDDPLVLEAWCPPLQLVDALRAVDLPGLAHLLLTARVQASVISYVPYFRDADRLMHYQF